MKRQWAVWGILGCLLCAGPAAASAPLVVPLWPEGALVSNPVRGPEVTGRDGSGLGAVSNVSQPRMEIHRAQNPNGSAVLIAGGGGYFRIQIARGSVPVAQWLASTGTTAVVLYYRLPADGWPVTAPFADAQRAMRLLRARAGEFGIDPKKIGMIGMSAGAHLTAITAVRPDLAAYAPIDDADQQPTRPDFIGLLYPVISLKAPLDTTRSKRELSREDGAVEKYSAELHVTRDTPPTFLAHAADDPIANVGHSLRMFDALRAHNAPAELHVFETGGHSWGLGQAGTAPAAWPRLFAAWARNHGFMTRDAVSARPAPESQTGRDE
jgi:acetyl esterase/lipase